MTHFIQPKKMLGPVKHNGNCASEFYLYYFDNKEKGVNTVHTSKRTTKFPNMSHSSCVTKPDQYYQTWRRNKQRPCGWRNHILAFNDKNQYIWPGTHSWEVTFFTSVLVVLTATYCPQVMSHVDFNVTLSSLLMIYDGNLTCSFPLRGLLCTSITNSSFCYTA